MAVEIRIDPTADTATIVATGAISGADVCGALEALYADPRFTSGMGELWDLRLARADVSPADVQAILAVVHRGSEGRGPGRSAIVASEDFEFGMARLVQAQIQAFPAEVQVFKDYDEAVRWLNDLPAAAGANDR